MDAGDVIDTIVDVVDQVDDLLGDLFGDGEDEVDAAEGQGEADAKSEPSGHLETRWI